MNRSVKKHSGQLTSTDGNPIRYDLYAPHLDSGMMPIIIFLHGFKGFKDWGTFPDAFFEMARQGFAVLAINFSHSGVGSDSDVVEYPDLFRSQTLSQELADIEVTLEAIKSGDIGKPAGLTNLFPIGMIGHSRGGHTAIAAAAEFDDISCLVTWAAVANVLDSWSDSMKKDWEKSGVTEVANTRTGQVLPIDRVLFDDTVENRNRLIAIERVKELYIPCMFIHGNQDESVPHRNSQLLYEACPGYEKEKLLIDGANHTFGSSHPFDSEDLPEKFSEVVDQTIRWFQLYLV